MRIARSARRTHDRSVWETIDPDGRPVGLSFGSWRHILETHDELGVPPEVVLDIVADPDHRAPGREAKEVWFYKAGLGPSRWIKVVVHYERGRGWIVTAFPRRSFP